MKPFWTPSSCSQKESQMTAFMKFVNKRYQLSCDSYQDLYDWSISQSGEFWASVWDFFDVICAEKPAIPLQQGRSILETDWMLGARLNFAENLLKEKSKAIALIDRNEQGKTVKTSYAELYKSVAALAKHLELEGIGPGDRVCAMVGNDHMTVASMLAVTSLGAVWCACSPDQGLDALVPRFAQVSPLVLIASDGYTYNGKKYEQIEKIKGLQKRIPSIQTTVLLPVLGVEDVFELEDSVSYADILEEHQAVSEIDFAQVPFSHPAFILFSSGTTGKPKCFVHSVGGTLLQHLKEHGLHIDLNKNEKIFYYTTCSWMMWNWLVSALSVGATAVLYDGSPFYPSDSVLFDMVDELEIECMGVGAKYLEMCEEKQVSLKKSHSMSSLRMVLSTGSALLPGSFDYVSEHIKSGVQLASISGGSDIISCFLLANPMLPVYRGTLQAPGLGMHVQVFNDSGEPVYDEKGELVCVNAFPSMPVMFWDDPSGDKYKAAYFSRFSGVWTHGDYAIMCENLSAVILGRSDSTLNPCGVRIGTAEIYSALTKIPSVSEGLAVGQRAGGDERIVLFVALEKGAIFGDELVELINTTIRTTLSVRHVPAVIIEVPELPKTRNGKLVELAVKRIVNGEDPGSTVALANPEALESFKDRPELLLQPSG